MDELCRPKTPNAAVSTQRLGQPFVEIGVEDSTIQRPSVNGNSEQQEPVCIARIRLDERTQTRAEMRQDVIEDYAEVLTDGRELPAVILFTEDGEEFVIGDGFHRVAAYVRAGRFEIPAKVITGDARGHCSTPPAQPPTRPKADSRRQAASRADASHGR